MSEAPWIELKEGSLYKITEENGTFNIKLATTNGYGSEMNFTKEELGQFAQNIVKAIKEGL